MKIALINGSPKLQGSNSGIIAAELAHHLGPEAGSFSINLKTGDASAIIADLKGYDVIVFVLPLYVDGIPAHFLPFLELAATVLEEQPSYFYAIVNAGLYEGRQTTNALDMLKVWCHKTGLHWGYGLGIGGGGVMTSIAGIPYGHGPRRKISNRLKDLAAAIKARRSGSNVYTEVGYSRWLYIHFAHAAWRYQLLHNGLKLRDLRRRP